MSFSHISNFTYAAVAYDMPMTEQLTLAVPAHWVPTMLHDDASGLSDADYRALQAWERDMQREFGRYTIAHVSPQPHFSNYHDAAEYGVGPCGCFDVDFHFNIQSPEA